MQKLCCVRTRQQYSASLDYFVTSLPPYLHQFSTISGGNCITGGHLTPEAVENIYSGVVSLRNLRVVIFLGKLNNLDIWGADIGNAYLEAFTDEKAYVVAGSEFEELEGYNLIFLKAIYGLKSSGKR